MKIIKKIYNIYTVAFILSIPLILLHKTEWTGVFDFLFHYVATPIFFTTIVICVIGGIKSFENNYIDVEIKK